MEKTKKGAGLLELIILIIVIIVIGVIIYLLASNIDNAIKGGIP